MSENMETVLEILPEGPVLDLGAGDGELAIWLARRGFTVDAVENDAGVYARLAEASAGTTVHPHLADLMDFPLAEESYALIIAQAALHFLRPTQLWVLADRLIQALVPGGVLFAEVFTTDDPGYEALRESGAREIEPNTFVAHDSIGIIHYFAPNELRRTFSALEILEYDASRRLDPDSEAGFLAGATLVGRRKPMG